MHKGLEGFLVCQVKALEKELIKRAEEQGLDIEPQIIVVTRSSAHLKLRMLCTDRLEILLCSVHAFIDNAAYSL